MSNPSETIPAVQNLMQAGEFPAALERLDQALQANPEHLDAWVLRGRCRLALQDYPAALVDLTRANELSPSQSACELDRAQALIMLQNWPEAVKALTRGIWYWNYLSGDPDPQILAQAHYYLAYCWLKLNDKAAMQVELENAAQFDPQGLLDPFQ